MESDNFKKEDCFEIEIPFNLFQYLNRENCNIQNLCRICLSDSNKELYPLISAANNNFLQDMFTAFTAIQVYSKDGLPSHICDLCRANVISCYEFKDQCLKSDCALKSLLKGEFVTKDEPSLANAEFNLPLEEEKPSHVEETIKDIDDNKRDNDLIQDLEYLEDLSGSDNEEMSIVQHVDKNIKMVLDDAKTDSLYLAVFPNKTKERKQKPHVCSFCMKRFRNAKAVKAHVKRIHGPSEHPLSFSCEQCKESFTTDHDLSLHKTVHAPGPVWTCAHCEKEFKGRSMFRRHIQRHMQRKRYSCERCGKPFAELYALRRHARVHTGEKVEKRYACHLCDKKYAQGGLLAAHVARHGDARPHVCAQCGKAFSSNRLLASHHRVHEDHKPHVCAYCNKRFRHESTLRTHERTHTGDRPYVCATCGKRFIQNSNLTLHMRTHTGDRPYSCETCGRAFSSGSTLKSHIRTHTGEKPYECPDCGKRFARMDLSAHRRLHSGERPYACGVCVRRFPTPARLRDHCRVHTGEKPFECAQCNQKFSSKSHLVKHVKTHQVKKKRMVVNRPKQSFSNVDDEKHNNVEMVENFISGDVIDTKEFIVEAMQDDANVTGEIIIPVDGSESQVGVETVGVVALPPAPAPALQLYRLDHSLLHIHSAGAQLTISKITSKVTANF